VLAERCQVNRSTLRRVEAGKTSGDIAMIEKVLHFLGYELDAIQAEAKKALIGELERDPFKRSQLAAQRVLAAKL
jgi:transcriptional regulator with XRE-family HTH domain